MYQDDLLLPWFDALVHAVGDVEVLDAHVHVGTSDPAGYQAEEEEVLDALAKVGGLGTVFPVNVPAGYTIANDAVLDLAARHPDRIVAFARLDPAKDALAEARRCHEAGARGLKLHPRGDDFELADPRLDEVFALADEHRLPVVVHAGVGSPEVCPQAKDRAVQNPGARVILAHAAIGGAGPVLPHLREVPNLLVDTSWWNPSDLWAVLCLVPATQVLHASDVPFNSPTQASVMSGRLALQAGLSPEEVRAVLGGNLRRLLDGDDLPTPAELPSAPGLAPELERLYVTLCSAVVPMLGGDEPGEALELAKAACDGPVDDREAVFDAVRRLIDQAEGCEEPDPLRPLRAPGWDVMLTAALVARTPDVALPPA